MKNQKLADLFMRIESHRFGAELGIASGYQQLIRLTEKNLAVRELVSLTADRDNAEFCLARVWEISSYRIDLRFENQFDIALVAYLFALMATHPDLGRIASSATLECSNCWWAFKLAGEVLSRQPESTLKTDVDSRAVKVPLSLPDRVDHKLSYPTVVAEPGAISTNDQLIQGFLIDRHRGLIIHNLAHPKTKLHLCSTPFAFWSARPCPDETRSSEAPLSNLYFEKFSPFHFQAFDHEPLTR